MRALFLCLLTACGSPNPTDVEGTVVGVRMENLTAWYGQLREDYSLIVVSQIDDPCSLSPHFGSDVSLVIGFCSSIQPGVYVPVPKAEFCNPGRVVAFVENGLGVDLAVAVVGEVNVINLTMRAELEIDFGSLGYLQGTAVAQFCDGLER